MENYIERCNDYDKSIVYNFKLGYGGIGDYLKFFMIILEHCIDNNIKIYHTKNTTEIQKYIKLKYDSMYINQNEISKLEHVTIKTPSDYYDIGDYNGNINLNEVFCFDNIVKTNVNNILTCIPTNYISIHLRLGDKFLETEKKFVVCKNDTRDFSEEKICKFIEDNDDKKIIFFCDNNNYRLKIKNKFKNIMITNSEIGHTSLSNTTNKQFLDSITDFYILSNSQLIYGASRSGFSKIAAQFNNVKFIT